MMPEAFWVRPEARTNEPQIGALSPRASRGQCEFRLELVRDGPPNRHCLGGKLFGAWGKREDGERTSRFCGGGHCLDFAAHYGLNLATKGAAILQDRVKVPRAR